MSPSNERMSREEADRHQWETTHKKILEAAAELFSSMDYHRTTTKQIAERAGVAKGTIFSHFQDKETLVLATIIYIMNKQMEEFYQQEFKSPEETLRTIVSYTFDLASQSPTLLQLIIQVFSDILGGCDEVREEKRKFYDELFEILEKFINELSGFFSVLGYKDPLTASRAFAAALDGLGLHVYTFQSIWKEDDKERLIDFIVTLFLRGVENE